MRSAVRWLWKMGVYGLAAAGLVGCAAGGIPSNAEITVSPTDISFTTSQGFGQVGAFLEFLDVNVSFINAAGFPQPVPNADLRVSISFDTQSSSGVPFTYLLDPDAPVNLAALAGGTIRTFDQALNDYATFQSPPTAQFLCNTSFVLYSVFDIQRLPYIVDNISALDACDGRPFGPGLIPEVPITDPTPTTCDDDTTAQIFPFLNNGDPYGCPAELAQLVGISGFCPSRYILPSGSTVTTDDEGSIAIPVVMLTFPPPQPSAATFDDDADGVPNDANGSCTFTFNPQVVEYSGTIRISAGNVVSPTVNFSISG